MIGRKLLEEVGFEPSDEQATAAERIILDFAVKDIEDLRQRMAHLLGLRLLDAIADPAASASHLNSAMRWLEQSAAMKDQPEDDNPMAAAIRNAREALREGGKLPDFEEYSGERHE